MRKKLGKRSRLLFVYGTLRRGFDGSQARALRRGAVWLGEARVRGRLVDLGGYPGLVRDGGAGWVLGEVYRLRDVRLWALLDDYEDCAPGGGGEYRRERLEVVLRRGGKLRAWAYVLNRSPVEAREIVGGNYIMHLQKLLPCCISLLRIL